QIEAPDAFVICATTLEVVTKDERVIGVDRVVDSRAEEQVTARHDEALAKLHHVEIIVEHGRADQFVVICLETGEIEKERSLLSHQWTTRVHVVLANLKGRS